MSDKIIEMKNVNKWFGDFQVLKNIDLSVEKILLAIQNKLRK